MSAFRFPRAPLAASLADKLLGQDVFDYSSGLFLAAPRRTGKSTFLREDLVPELETRGALPVYIDLWATPDGDPAALMIAGIKAAAGRAQGWLKSVGRAIRPKTVAIGGFKVDFDTLGNAEGATLTDALAELARRAESDVVLIVDEAQHALSSAAGVAAMFALKAARDAINQTRGTEDQARLAMLFTGSDRDKLANLTLRRDQPFFGATLQDFPLLGRDYADAYAGWVNARLATDLEFSGADMYQAFEIVGHRPELLQEVVQAVAFVAPDKLVEEARARQARLLESYAGQFYALLPLHQQVLRLLADDEQGFRPFAAATLQALRQEDGKTVTAAQVQAALEALRKEKLIWSSGRGAYAIEDQDMAEWLRRNPVEDARR